MSRDSDNHNQKDKQKKRFSIVHKPFAKGRVNLFNPPKKNPNGHLASAKLWHEDISAQLSVRLPETEETEELPTITEETLVNKSNKLLNPWKISAISLIILGNLIAAITIFVGKYQEQTIANTVEGSRDAFVSGKTDLTAQEFIKLDLNNLKNIDPKKTEKAAKSTEVASEKSLENLPLAIPPTSLPQDIVLPKTENKSEYYYILTEYNGDRSLELAKAKIPNVSLINFPQGVFIYMGAFTKKEPARQFIKQLKELGLEGYIYPFE